MNNNDAIDTKTLKLKFVFECDDCKKRFLSWMKIESHLQSHPDHAPEGYGLVNVYRKDVYNI